jgi:hypothetical protein
MNNQFPVYKKALFYFSKIRRKDANVQTLKILPLTYLGTFRGGAELCFHRIDFYKSKE